MISGRTSAIQLVCKGMSMDIPIVDSLCVVSSSSNPRHMRTTEHT
jgi:hypothetical protein